MDDTTPISGQRVYGPFGFRSDINLLALLWHTGPGISSEITLAYRVTARTLKVETAQVRGKPRLPPKRGRPTDDEVERRRTLVLELTLRVFVEEGYEAVTTRRIAEMAGISKKSLYTWFPDKFALLKEVNLKLRERLTSQRQPIDPNSSLETALYHLGRAQLMEAYQPEAFAIARFQAREGYKYAEFRQIIRDDYLASTVAEIADVIRSRLPNGALNEDQLNDAAMSFSRLIGSQIVFTIMHNLPIPDAKTIDAEAKKSADILANGVKGLARPAKGVTPQGAKRATRAR